MNKSNVVLCPGCGQYHADGGPICDLCREFEEKKKGAETIWCAVCNKHHVVNVALPQCEALLAAKLECCECTKTDGEIICQKCIKEEVEWRKECPQDFELGPMLQETDVFFKWMANTPSETLPRNQDE